MAIRWGTMMKHVAEEKEAGVGSRKIEVCSDEGIVQECINP